MGAIVQAVCPCGYVSAEFFEGRGMDSYGSVRALTTCSRCREVVAINVRAKRYRCKHCRRTLPPSFRSYEEWVQVRGVAELACPRCARKPLPFKMLGLWD